MTREPGRAPPRHAHGDLTSLAPHERLPEILAQRFVWASSNSLGMQPWALSLPDKELCLREALAVCTPPAPGQSSLSAGALRYRAWAQSWMDSRPSRALLAGVGVEE